MSWDQLSPEQQVTLQRRLKADPWFYARHTPLLIENKSDNEHGAAGELVPLVPNFAQRYTFNKLNQQAKAGRLVRALVPKPRQLGMTTGFTGFYYQRCATRFNVEAYMLLQDLIPAGKVYTKLDKMRRNQMPMFRPELASFETGRRMTFKETESTIVVESVRKRGVGRSQTLHHVHCTELPSWDDAKSVMDGIEESVPEWDAWRTSIVLESTCEGMGDYWYWMCQRALRDEGMYQLIFLPWWIEPSYARAPLTKELRHSPLTSDEEDLGKRIIAEAPSYGMPVPDADTVIRKLLWRRGKIENKGYDTFCQEYPADVDEAFLGTGRPFLPTPAVRFHRNRIDPSTNERFISEPAYKLRVRHMGDKVVDGRAKRLYGRVTDDKGPLHLWFPPDPKASYILPADVASGEARDRSCIHILKMLHSGGLDQVGCWHGHVGARELAYILAYLSRWFNNGLMVPENNGPGAVVIDTLNTDIRFKGMRLYQYLHRDRETMERLTKFGFNTGPGNRPTLLEDLWDLFATPDDLIIRHGETMTELSQFSYNKQGRPEAPQGGYDDCVIPLGIAAHVRHEARRIVVNRNVTPSVKYDTTFGSAQRVPVPVDMPGVRRREQTAN